MTYQVNGCVPNGFPLYPEFLLYEFFHTSFLGVGDGVHLSEIALLRLQRRVEAEDEAGSDKVDDACWGKAINLMPQDVLNTLVIVWYLPSHLCVIIESTHNLGDVQTRLHIEMSSQGLQRRAGSSVPTGPPSS